MRDSIPWIAIRKDGWALRSRSALQIVSPFLVPSHLRVRIDGDFVWVDYRYLDGEEPMFEAGRSESGVAVHYGRITRRLRAISFPKETAKRLIESAGPGAAGELARFVNEELKPKIREAVLRARSGQGAHRQPGDFDIEAAIEAIPECASPS